MTTVIDNLKKKLQENTNKIFHVYGDGYEAFLYISKESFYLQQVDDDDDGITHKLNGKEIAFDLGDNLWDFIEEILEEAAEEARSEENSLKWIEEVSRKMP